MPRGDNIRFSGKVIEDAGHGKFTISVDDSNKQIKAGISGKMRKNRIMVLAGDRVEVEVSPFDMSHGLIVTRKR